MTNGWWGQLTFAFGLLLLVGGNVAMLHSHRMLRRTVRLLNHARIDLQNARLQYEKAGLAYMAQLRTDSEQRPPDGSA